MYIGIDIGGTNIKTVLTDGRGRILGFRSDPTGSTADEIESGIMTAMNGLLSERRARGTTVRAIGIGAPGQIDTSRGIIISSPNVPAWCDYPIAARIRKLSGRPVCVENDATVALMGERWLGHGRRYRTWIMLTLGTGIGGGAVIDNAIYLGRNGGATEFGHTTIDHRGPSCPCGSRGCLERYASAPALVRNARRALRNHPESIVRSMIQSEPLTAALLYRAARRGDAFAIEQFSIAGSSLGIGIANFINIFNPEAVIIGGGMSGAHRFFMPALRAAVDRFALSSFRKGIRYHIVKDPVRGAALGAARAAIERYA